jgi:hypothetical protein
MTKDSLFTYNNIKRFNNVHLTERLVNHSLINEFEKIFVRDVPYSIVDYSGKPTQLSDAGNIFVISYDTSENISHCVCNVLQFYNHKLELTKEQAERKIAGEVYKSYNKQDIIDEMNINIFSLVFDNPEEKDKLVAIYVQNIITKHAENSSNYKEFLKKLFSDNELCKYFEDEELELFKLYMKGYDSEFEVHAIIDYAALFYS